MSHLFTDQGPCLSPSPAPSPYLFRHTGQHGDQHSFPLRNAFPVTGLAGTHSDERL